MIHCSLMLVLLELSNLLFVFCLIFRKGIYSASIYADHAFFFFNNNSFYGRLSTYFLTRQEP